MSRTEKIIAFLLGTLVFVGLFVFIFTSLRNPPAAPPLGDTAFDSGEDEPFDFNVASDTETETGMVTEEKDAATAVSPKPAPVNAGKK